MKNQSDQEIEVKFYIHNLKAIKVQLVAEDAVQVQERCLEVNLRFDQQDHGLSKDRRVLRLRKDTQNILTYKGPAEMGKSVSIRQEIEVLVDDFDTTRRLLEGLGYQVYMVYEKYRCMYRYHKVIVTLDELPYGNFVEIEGPDARTIQKTADLLGLNWKDRVTTSYIYLFEELKKNHSVLDGRNLTFADLKGLKFTPDEFNIHPADLR
jgi:adenylate cyclase class 2